MGSQKFTDELKGIWMEVVVAFSVLCVWRNMGSQKFTDELKGIWMEVVVAFSIHMCGGTWEARRNFSQGSWFSN